jgi:hypothetical protein
MDPAEHPSAGCMTGWGLTPACGIVSSSLFSSGPVRFREAGTRACAGCGRSRPFLLPVAWSAGEVPVSFGSWPWPARQQPPSTTRQARSGLIDGRSRPRDRSVMRARALTGAAGSGCGRPGDESSGHHQTERLAGLDEAEQRGWWIEGCLPCHPILYRKVPDRPSDYGGGRWASRWELLPSDTKSEGRSTAGCPAMARLVIPLVIPPAITRQVRDTLAGRPR